MILHFLGVLLVDTGLALLLVGAVSLVRPLRFLKITSHRKGLGTLTTGVLLVALGVGLPASETRIDTPRTALDRFVPAYQFSERHEIRVAAPPARTFQAIRSVTAREITLFRTLTAIRRFGRPGPESILNAPEHQPILDVATQTSFLLLAHEPHREIVVGLPWLTALRSILAGVAIEVRHLRGQQAVRGHEELVSLSCSCVVPLRDPSTPPADGISTRSGGGFAP